MCNRGATWCYCIYNSVIIKLLQNYRYYSTKEGFFIMSNTEFIGYLAVYGIVFLAGIIGLIKPIIKLNVNIQNYQIV